MTETNKLMTLVANAKQVWLDAVEEEEETVRNYGGEFHIFWFAAMRRKALAAYRLAQKNWAATLPTRDETAPEKTDD